MSSTASSIPWPGYNSSTATSLSPAWPTGWGFLSSWESRAVARGAGRRRGGLRRSCCGHERPLGPYRGRGLRGPPGSRPLSGGSGQGRQLPRRPTSADGTAGRRGSLFAAGPILVSAGGSRFFDRVALVLGERAQYGGHDVRLVVRSGCYAVHDHGTYADASPLDGPGHQGPGSWGRSRCGRTCYLCRSPVS